MKLNQMFNADNTICDEKHIKVKMLNQAFFY